MQEFERASLHKDFVNEENNTGSYIFEPLERGFGITIGNTICRTLLTSVPGTRIVGFKVSGFDGKATMIEGILEDIYRISLNLKAVQLYNDGEGFQTLHISKKGPATIQAADIICPEAVEVVDPEQVICTLEKGASLEMEIYAVTGTGYKSSIENKVSYDFGEDVVVLDATFTPIRKADNFWEYTCQLLDSTLEEELDVNFCKTGMETRFLTNYQPEFSEEGLKIALILLYSSLVA